MISSITSDYISIIDKIYESNKINKQKLSYLIHYIDSDIRRIHKVLKYINKRIFIEYRNTDKMTISLCILKEIIEKFHLQSITYETEIIKIIFSIIRNNCINLEFLKFSIFFFNFVDIRTYKSEILIKRILFYVTEADKSFSISSDESVYDNMNYFVSNFYYNLIFINCIININGYFNSDYEEKYETILNYLIYYVERFSNDKLNDKFDNNVILNNNISNDIFKDNRLSNKLDNDVILNDNKLNDVILDNNRLSNNPSPINNNIDMNYGVVDIKDQSDDLKYIFNGQMTLIKLIRGINITNADYFIDRFLYYCILYEINNYDLLSENLGECGYLFILSNVNKKLIMEMSDMNFNNLINLGIKFSSKSDLNIPEISTTFRKLLETKLEMYYNDLELSETKYNTIVSSNINFNKYRKDTIIKDFYIKKNKLLENTNFRKIYEYFLICIKNSRYLNELFYFLLRGGKIFYLFFILDKIRVMKFKMELNLVISLIWVAESVECLDELVFEILKIFEPFGDMNVFSKILRKIRCLYQRTGNSHLLDILKKYNMSLKNNDYIEDERIYRELVKGNNYSQSRKSTISVDTIKNRRKSNISKGVL